MTESGFEPRRFTVCGLFLSIVSIKISSIVTREVNNWSTEPQLFWSHVPFCFLPGLGGSGDSAWPGAMLPFPAYLGFLWMLLLVAYGQRDPNAYNFNRHLKHSFTQGFSAVLSFQEFFMWANTTLVKNLYSHHPAMVPLPQDLCQPPGVLFFLGTGVGLCQHQPYREPITIGHIL